MVIERQYLAVLDLTHLMLSAANSQDWESLAALEKQRAQLIVSIREISPAVASLEPALAHSIAKIITEIETESDVIFEQAQTWQQQVRMLLRLDRPDGV